MVTRTDDTLGSCFKDFDQPHYASDNIISIQKHRTKNCHALSGPYNESCWIPMNTAWVVLRTSGVKSISPGTTLFVVMQVFLSLIRNTPREKCTYKSEKQDDCECFTPPVNNNCVLLGMPCADTFPKSKSELNKPSEADPSARIFFCEGE